MKDVYYIDGATNQIKIGVHAYFDEAHFKVPKDNAPLAAQNLQTLGYMKPRDIYCNGKFQDKYNTDKKMLRKQAIQPSMTAPESGILQIYSSQVDTQIEAGHSSDIQTDIILLPPPGTYVQIMQPSESHETYLANMMRCLLHAANLGPEYWSFSLTHAVFINNRIPHQSINMTPFEAITGQ